MGRPKKDEARKEEILEAFERCVIREGITSTTLQKVADEAGLPRSLVRYFVGNRDEMIGLLISRVIGRAYRPLRELDFPDASFAAPLVLAYVANLCLSLTVCTFAPESSMAVNFPLFN